MIERFYDVLDGEILIDGVDIKKYSIQSLRKHIGYVMQEPILFKRPLIHNIKYGRLEASEEEVLEASRKAYIYEMVKQNLDSEAPMSGGQKQRVAIARAILKDPKILLLDEATSALDPESEEKVKDSLNKLMENRTSILVAHR